jgi:hypothetical protein
MNSSVLCPCIMHVALKHNDGPISTENCYQWPECTLYRALLFVQHHGVGLYTSSGTIMRTCACFVRVACPFCRLRHLGPKEARAVLEAPEGASL